MTTPPTAAIDAGAAPIGRLPVVVLATLAAATVGAFFLTQHLKSQNPFINGDYRADPPAINPVAGRVCRDLARTRVSFKSTRVGFYLQTNAQVVDVFVVDSKGQQVATARGSGRYARPGPKHYVFYSWDGGLSTGRVVPDGTYHFLVSLPAEDRTFQIPTPIQVITRPPQPQVTSVTQNGARAKVPVISPLAGQGVTIHYQPDRLWRDARIQIIRTGLPGGHAKVVYSFGADQAINRTGWNGRINGVPAPAGTYIIGMRVTDQACNVGTFPVVVPPPPGETPHAGVTVRYLAAEPPQTPVPAGTHADVFVDSRTKAYTWRLRNGGSTRVLAHGNVSAAEVAAAGGVLLKSVRLPGPGPGLYELSLASGIHRTAVPLVASAVGRRAAAKVLVVLPALTWQGENPVDDTGDGLPTTLAAGEQIDVDRPFTDGLPPGLPGEIALLRYLASQHDSYQLTTDIALALGIGPSLSARSGVILDGSLAWLPSSLGVVLRTFVESGGRVVAIGTDSMQATAPLRLGSASTGPTAGPPEPDRLGVDPFGARHGSLVPHTGELITVLDDQLGIFGSLPAVSGFSSYQPIYPPSKAATSEAGIAEGIPAIAGFRLGHGSVVEVGLPGFGSSLAGNVDAQELVSNLWRQLSG